MALLCPVDLLCPEGLLCPEDLLCPEGQGLPWGREHLEPLCVLSLLEDPSSREDLSLHQLRVYLWVLSLLGDREHPAPLKRPVVQVHLAPLEDREHPATLKRPVVQVLLGLR